MNSRPPCPCPVGAYQFLDGNDGKNNEYFKKKHFNGKAFPLFLLCFRYAQETDYHQFNNGAAAASIPITTLLEFYIMMLNIFLKRSMVDPWIIPHSPIDPFPYQKEMN